MHSFLVLIKRKLVLIMEANSCICCRFLSLPKDREEHIIQRHFLFKDWQDIKPGESFFLCNSISPEELFHVVRMIPRFQFRQGRWSKLGRFVYFLSFDFDVGVFPLEPGRSCTTNIVQIVCKCVQCPGCRIHVPTEIVSIYPVHGN